MQKSLTQLFFTKTGKSATKWEQYLSIYEVELGPYLVRGAPVSILEIGVQNGGSLELWGDYLPAGSRIIGIDIDPKVGELTFANPLISAHVQDATDAAGIDDLLQHQDFDIIVDDGSHLCSHVKQSFDILFGRLKPGGKYIIEDLHTSYFDTFEGGYLEPGSSIEWIKSLGDALNLDYFQADPRLDAPTRERMRALNAAIGRVSMYDSVAVIEKLRSEKTRPYRRLCAGETSSVVPMTDWLYGTSLEGLQTVMFGFPAARVADGLLARKLHAANHEIVELKLALERANRELSELKDERSS
ncbi:class I SAM-dependent methyltransferase [Methylobacterium sp. B1]|uniref:class I SAM-dependent methyltransferase n=1 Tax=Methylobacterium sp. B1 TaxID=91459 RepID=UPI00034D9203|nr:class I SAM-dependent methyltransferase [Methylobacterium sp. B1]